MAGSEKEKAERDAGFVRWRSKGGAMGDSAYAALAQFRLQVRTFLAFSETAAQRAGLTPQQHQALLAIKGFAGRDAASIGDVARFLLIRHHTAVGLMDRIEARC